MHALHARERTAFTVSIVHQPIWPRTQFFAVLRIFAHKNARIMFGHGVQQAFGGNVHTARIYHHKYMPTISDWVACEFF